MRDCSVLEAGDEAFETCSAPDLRSITPVSRKLKSADRQRGECGGVSRCPSLRATSPTTCGNLESIRSVIGVGQDSIAVVLTSVYAINCISHQRVLIESAVHTLHALHPSARPCHAVSRYQSGFSSDTRSNPLEGSVPFPDRNVKNPRPFPKCSSNRSNAISKSVRRWICRVSAMLARASASADSPPPTHASTLRPVGGAAKPLRNLPLDLCTRGVHTPSEMENVTTPSPRPGAVPWSPGSVASPDHRLPQTTKSPNFAYLKRSHAYFCYLLMRTYPNSDFHAISSHSLPLGFGGSE